MFAQNFPKEKWFNADEPFKKSGSSKNIKQVTSLKLEIARNPKSVMKDKSLD